jgi:hypothetical protein
MPLTKILSALGAGINNTTTSNSEGGAVTTSVIQGLIKTFATLDGTGTIALRDSFNQSSASDEGTGIYDFNFTNAFSSRNRTILGTCNKDESSSRPYVVQELNTPTASDSRLNVNVTNGPGDSDVDDLYMIGAGDLA